MNKLIYIGAGAALLAASASAQEREAKAKLDAEKRVVEMRTVGAIKGITVKGAPYSADEVTESTQALADGTRIHRENKTTVYRDSEGRTRRETPESIVITDPVANVTYILNPKTMTGQKLTMGAGQFAFFNTTGDGVAGATGTSTFTFSTNRENPTIVVNGQKLDDKAVQEALARAKANGDVGPQVVTYERHVSTTGNGAGGGVGVGVGNVRVATETTASVLRRKLRGGEPLGKQTIEGVNAEGTRHVSTIEAGAIGNDRPIQITDESWYSDELQMAVLSKHSDPRTGEEIFRLTNIRRTEPGSYLFQPPAGYQITEPGNK